jgi:hypothetical protein
VEEVSAAKGKKKKKGAKAQAKDEDLDAILAELGMAPPTKATQEDSANALADVPPESTAADGPEEAAPEDDKEDQDADSKVFLGFGLFSLVSVCGSRCTARVVLGLFCILGCGGWFWDFGVYLG